MDAQAIEKMRSNVIDYYDTRLTSKDFVRKVETDQGKVTTIMLHPRLVCTPQENEAGKQFMQELTRTLEDMITEPQNPQKGAHA
jgi:hypothetical protein